MISNALSGSAESPISRAKSLLEPIGIYPSVTREKSTIPLRTSLMVPSPPRMTRVWDVQIFCQIVDDTGCMPLILGEKDFISYLLFLKDRFDVFSRPWLQDRIWNVGSR